MKAFLSLTSFPNMSFRLIGNQHNYFMPSASTFIMVCSQEQKLVIYYDFSYGTFICPCASQGKLGWRKIQTGRGGLFHFRTLDTSSNNPELPPWVQGTLWAFAAWVQGPMSTGHLQIMRSMSTKASFTTILKLLQDDTSQVLNQTLFNFQPVDAFLGNFGSCHPSAGVRTIGHNWFPFPFNL